MELKANIMQFLIRISVFSLLLAFIAYTLVGQGFLDMKIDIILSIQLFVFLVTSVVHLFLLRSAAAEARVQKFMFNFMLSTTLKIFIYCGAFGALIYVGNNVLTEGYSNLSLFLVLFTFYLLYTVFEVGSILKFVRKMG